MKVKLSGYTKNRLKRSSFVHETKKLNKEYAHELTVPTTPLGMTDIIDPLENDLSAVTVCTVVPYLEQGKQQHDSIRKSLTVAMISEEYPPEIWTHVYTDGSATNAIKDGGAGIVIHHPNGMRETAYAATGTHCSNYRAETEALMKAVSMVEDSTEVVSNVVFLTDALSVIEALTNNKAPQLAKTMQQLSTSCKVAIQWIPAHCGVPGNEKADQLAKLGAQSEQPEVCVSYKEKTTIIKSLTRPRQEADAYHLLSRAEQVTMVRLRSGHNKLNAHMYKKYRLVPSPTCPCGEEDQTAEHILQRCKRHNQERKATWPSDTSVHQKLQGNIEDLRRTTQFITLAGLVV